MADLRNCLWCNKPFEPRHGGQPQKFCQPAHCAAFHSAARRWAEKAVRDGRLTVAELRSTVDRTPDTEKVRQRNLHVTRKRI